MVKRPIELYFLVGLVYSNRRNFFFFPSFVPYGCNILFLMVLWVCLISVYSSQSYNVLKFLILSHNMDASLCQLSTTLGIVWGASLISLLRFDQFFFL